MKTNYKPIKFVNDYTNFASTKLSNKYLPGFFRIAKMFVVLLISNKIANYLLVLFS